MTSPLYRTPDDEITPDLQLVRGRYDSLARDVETVRGLASADPALSAEVAQLLHAEARQLDAERWQEWFSWCTDDTMLWVPVNTRTPHPGSDQGLFLDDRRRLEERLWRFMDPNAWAIVPSGQVVRAVTGVEAWPDAERPGEVLVSSCLSLQHVRHQAVFTTVGRQVHRLGRTGDRWTLIQKTLLLPHLAAGSPHLGWLI
ncbi:hypothetical protein M4I32_12675 [Microbacterium sp. LRZ72]|uniref:aromatic-ring-hydroxylating dioxygenase subunit beta n=1 Tax=Microbacterium sp. LRZ72 TaxID=2942481 RepID=UPI0029BBBD98|nr:aromatic-ring-hydroxylating dioxygenase subunit beta [Microbacterium sp. LRZ72]MDX2377656.1 hypothetical protein [Microbacterium sp. LRZ72]